MNETNEKKNVGKSTGTSGRYRKTPAKKTAEAKTTVATKRASEKPANGNRRDGSCKGK